MNLSAPFIKRPVMTTLVMLTICIAGIIAFFQLPKNDLPTIEYPNIQITAGYLGANSEAILNQITIPLEKELSLVKGIQEMKSISSPGFSSISLSFDLSKNMDRAIRDVQAAVTRAEGIMPHDLNPKVSFHLKKDTQEPIMWILLTSDQSTIDDITSYSENYIIPRLSRIEGVAQVKTYGAKKAIWLRINPELMTARHIGFNQVVDTIKEQTTDKPLGTIETNNKALSIELPSTILEAKDLKNLYIGNTLVRIKDIGEVSEEADENIQFNFVTKDSTTLALLMGIQKISDGNTCAISKAVRESLDILNKELPHSLSLKIWFDKSIWIIDSLRDVEWTLFFAFILVVLVIYLSLGRLAESLIASAALPISLIGTCLVMYLANFSIDLLSLLALTLSVGFVVDDAIVVLENIIRYQDKGYSRLKATLIGSKQISFTILSMTLSLVAVFIPLLFMPGMNGRLFKEFSLTLAIAILVSGFISITLTPMLCGQFLKVHTRESKLQKWINNLYNSSLKFYASSLKRCFNFPFLILFFAVSCLAASLFFFTKLPVELIPSEDRGFFFAHVNLPTGTEKNKIVVYQKKLETLIQANPNIRDALSLNYEGSLLFLISLKEKTKRSPQKHVIDEFQKTFDAIPGIQTFIQPYQLINLDLDFGSAGQYKYIVNGINFDDVNKATTKLVEELKKNNVILSAQSSIKNDKPMLSMKINEELSHKLGFNKAQIQLLLQYAYGQGIVGSIQKNSQKEYIYMEVLKNFHESSLSPEKLYLSTPNGSFIPLKSVATFEEKIGSPNLVHRDQLPSGTIRFSLAEGVAQNIGLQKVNELATLILPSNVTGIMTGSAKAISSTITHTLILLLAAALVMYGVLGILYESFIHPLIILSSVPFAGLGGVITLFLFSEPISIFSAVGFLLLIGIVKKNGIMMVDYALEAQKNGLTPQEAILDACLVRFRPIMMTTFAAIMGAIPLIIQFGEGIEMRRGLGLVIIGGLLFSQILTLYVTPILYLTFEKLRHLKKKI